MERSLLTDAGIAATAKVNAAAIVQKCASVIAGQLFGMRIL